MMRLVVCVCVHACVCVCVCACMRVCVCVGFYLMDLGWVWNHNNDGVHTRSTPVYVGVNEDSTVNYRRRKVNNF